MCVWLYELDDPLGDLMGIIEWVHWLELSPMKSPFLHTSELLALLLNYGVFFFVFVCVGWDCVTVVVVLLV